MAGRRVAAFGAVCAVALAARPTAGDDAVAAVERRSRDVVAAQARRLRAEARAALDAALARVGRTDARGGGSAARIARIVADLMTVLP